MKIIEHIARAREPLMSYEIIPPPRGRSVRDVIEIVEKLVPLNPPWIDVTSHSSSAYYHEKPDGSIERRIYRKRPGTIGICGIIQNRFRIDTVAHILCLGFTREETEDALIELHYLGIENVMALRGDALNYKKEISRYRSTNEYAIDLVRQINYLREGRFLEDISDSAPLDFCVGVAGYPEKHFEAANLKTDLNFLKEKVEAGAHYIVTQMFFDNQKYYTFVQKCRELGIQVPIIPGIKILKSVEQLKSLPKTFHIDIPEPLAEEVLASPQHAEEIGFRWALNQVMDLLEKGVPVVHFYVMNDINRVIQLVRTVQK
ncbi:MAG: methylenetetrahydrofolate reductase [Bdellovibrionaceae bacterium]|nr:methylenetetrahydrofolate reductase [Pseudobdellovibrionaceae bacterium]MDW8189571.1 methylenetetrahydrofolate reductase [Pseudobdellovibrionaceae bacterium]